MALRQQGSFFSAYKVHVDMTRREAGKQLGQCSTQDDQHAAMFSYLWKVRYPPRVHHFLWRFVHNSHPMYMNISRRGIELDTRCAACGLLFEDGGHLFFKCKAAKHKWRALLLEDVREQLVQLTSPKEVLQAILKLPEERKLLTVACLW